MSFPEPVPGLVIRYSYLWHAEHRRGQEEGLKDRPCAIVLTAASEDRSLRVTVLPVTRTAPGDPNLAIEIPAAVKRRLSLYGNRSWVALSWCSAIRTIFDYFPAIGFRLTAYDGTDINGYSPKSPLTNGRNGSPQSS